MCADYNMQKSQSCNERAHLELEGTVLLYHKVRSMWVGRRIWKEA